MSTLAVRDDRLGDLILTLPALTALRRRHGALAVAVSVENADLLAHDRGIDSLHVLPPTGRGRVFRHLLRRLQPDRVLFFRSRFPLGWIAWWCGVAVRVGPFSNLDGLAHTQRIRQHRSRSEASEAEHGLALARCVDAEGEARAELELPLRYRVRARRWVEEIWKPLDALRVAVHPGGGGSARNWTEARYRELVREIVSEPGTAVVVTAAPGEEAMARRVAGTEAEVHVGWAGPLAHAALLGEVDQVVSGSTGTMHLAAAMGTATLSIFSAIRAESPRRWGALGARARSVQPQVPECERCVGAACPVWDCLDRLSVADVARMAREPGR